MPFQIVPARTIRLSLSDDTWVEVKARLNHGEYQKVFERSYKESATGEMRSDPFRLPTEMLLAYLVDWNVSDMPIRDASRDEVEQRLNLLDQDDFLEIKAAIETHANAIEAARAEKKRIRIGGGVSSPTSPSLVAVDGAMSG